MRAWSEILAIWAAPELLSENKHDAMCVVLLRLTKTKIQHDVFFLSALALHLTKLSNVDQEGFFDFAQVKASVELRINKLSHAAANPRLKLIAKSLIFIKGIWKAGWFG